MNNILKVSLALGVLMVALSISYYFVLVLPQRVETEESISEITEKGVKAIEKEIKVGDEFSLKNGRVLTVTEVTVGNYYSGSPIDPNMKRAQVAIRIHSDGGALSQEEYSKMYILKGDQLIKLSNSGGAPWGQYWFEMPKTSDFNGMKLYFGNEVVVILTPYIKNNDF